MTNPIFAFVAQGVATEASRYRAGARHALLLFACGVDVLAARATAIAGAEVSGWQFVDVQREKEIGTDASAIADEVLRSAAEIAVVQGFGMVVYSEEIPPNA